MTPAERGAAALANAKRNPLPGTCRDHVTRAGYDRMFLDLEIALAALAYLREDLLTMEFHWGGDGCDEPGGRISEREKNAWVDTAIAFATRDVTEKIAGDLRLNAEAWEEREKDNEKRD